jgi:hypothetical protein
VAAANKLRKQVLAPFSGVLFEIRRVKLAEYMAELRDLPLSLAPATVEELQKLKDSFETMSRPDQEKANRRAMVVFLSKGIVRMKFPDEDQWRKPNIWYGDEEECPEGAVSLDDLATDADLLVQEIADYSFNMLGGKPFEGFFRQQGSTDPGHGSQEVRPETVESTGQDTP